jgi:hypothetical protein
MTHDDDRPRTHRWVRRPGPKRQPAKAASISASVPSGELPDAAMLAARTQDALIGWPIVVLRIGSVVGTSGIKPGKHPGRWLRQQLGQCVDELMCSCRAPRCTRTDCDANLLLGRHGKGPDPDGEAWAPITVRAAELPTGRIAAGEPIRFEVVLAGGATRQVPFLTQALLGDSEVARTGPLDWRSVHALVPGEDGELRWRKVGPGQPPPLLPLADLTEPKIRRGRLTLTFLTATPMARQGEEGTPTADLSLAVDRMLRSLGAWMGRTGHRGPRLPVDDLLRSAAEASLSADHRRFVTVPAALLGAQQAGGDGSISSLGSMTWTGSFDGLAPLLRAVHYIGMGPGRQFGLGHVVIR